VIGGALSAALGWRSTFVFLAVFCGAVGALLLLFLPETHQYYTLKQLSIKDPDMLQQIAEAPKILAAKPVFRLPLSMLAYFYKLAFAPYVLVNAWANAALFGCLTLWPVFLAAPPYSLGQAMVGVTYLADGLGAVSGSLLGGILSDKAAVRWHQAPEGRMVWNVAVALVCMPPGFLLYGWGFSVNMHIAGLLASSFLVSFGAAALMPGVYSYMSCVDQANAGAATAAVNAGWCMLAGVVVLVSVTGVSSMGVGPYFTMLTGIHVVLSLFAGACIAHRLRRS
jgi:MFS family permease